MVYHIHDPENCEDYYIRITEEQERLLDWLESRSLIYNEIQIRKENIPQLEDI